MCLLELLKFYDNNIDASQIMTLVREVAYYLDSHQAKQRSFNYRDLSAIKKSSNQGTSEQ